MEQIFHYIADLLATFIGVRIYLKSKQEDSLNSEQRLFVILGALIGALIGSRLIAALENPQLFWSGQELIYYVANKTIIGGIAGGILGIEIVKKIIGISTWTGDRTLVPLAVAIIIGRIGCFVSGVQDGTVGNACNYLWCLEQGDGILRHPNALYEISFVLLFLFLYRLIRKHQTSLFLPILKTPGAIFRLFIVGYFLLRLNIETNRDTSVIISICVF